MKVDITCESCGKVFKAAPSSKRTFCTRTCYREFCKTEAGKLYKSSHILKTKERKGTSGKETRKCVRCDAPFEVLKSVILSYCSKECRYLHLKENKEPMLEKMRETNTARYGKHYTSQVGSIKERIKKIIKQKYGKNHPRFSKAASIKRIATKLRRYGHPYGNRSFGASKEEKQISDFLHEIDPNLVIRLSNKSILGGKELDIYLPDLKLAIEYNGLYYHSELFNSDKHYHLHKTEDCEKQGVRLIQIFSDEWKNKREIVENKLRHLIQKSEVSYQARKCTVQEIDSRTSNQFLQKHHLQGSAAAKIKLGLFFGERLVAVMTFGERRIALGGKASPGSYELVRFAAEGNVIGGASKLLAFFERTYSPTEITSYADRRWSEGKLYEKLGFSLIRKNRPTYWYTKDFTERLYRYGFRKSVLVEAGADSSLSESKIMEDLGYVRVWDCGTLSFQKTYTPAIYI